jgi:hypothetical protein
MSDHASDLQETNSLEVNFDPDSWKTEFYEEIKSVRLNGQKIAEIRDLMTEMKSLRESTDRKIQVLIFTIFLLSILLLGIVVLGVQHLDKLKAEKVNEIVEAGINRFDMTDQTFIPVEAFRQLSEFNQAIYWDKDTERWYIERHKRGTKQKVNDLILFPHMAYNNLPKTELELKQSPSHPTSKGLPFSQE